ncbi:YdcF family protein, partial [Streptococcus suis]
IAEGQAMANYAMEQGIPAEDIIIENQSTNTEENLKFSYALMKSGSRFALVTNYYHVFRALLLARKLKIKCIGYGAKTKFYFSLNAFIREFVGYVVMSRKTH